MLKGWTMNWDHEWLRQLRGDLAQQYKALTDLPSEVGEDQILIEKAIIIQHISTNSNS